MWDLTVSVPDHCLSFYFGYDSACIFDRIIIKLAGKILNEFEFQPYPSRRY